MEDKKEYTADDFLRSVREAKIEMRRCEYRMEELRSQCEKTTPGYGGTVVGGSGDDHKDSLMIAVAEHVTKLRGKAEAYIRRVMLAEDFIDTLPEPRQRIILRLRYIDLLKWEDVLPESRAKDKEGCPKAGGHVLAWCKTYGKGRVFYTALGHNPKDWSKREFLYHLLMATKWAMGELPDRVGAANK